MIETFMRTVLVHCVLLFDSFLFCSPFLNVRFLNFILILLLPEELTDRLDLDAMLKQYTALQPDAFTFP